MKTIVTIILAFSSLCVKGQSNIFKTNPTIRSEVLSGKWQTTDSLKSIIEFIDLGSEVELYTVKSRPYSFLKDSTGQVHPSGFYPNWPPFDCDLKLLAPDSLEVIFSQMGMETYKAVCVKIK